MVPLKIITIIHGSSQDHAYQSHNSSFHHQYGSSHDHPDHCHQINITIFILIMLITTIVLLMITNNVFALILILITIIISESQQYHFLHSDQAAMKLPKSTADEQKARDAAMQVFNCFCIHQHCHPGFHFLNPD